MSNMLDKDARLTKPRGYRITKVILDSVLQVKLYA